ncbi:MAG: PfkB family carbohydrate kinase [Chloroflexota bacterium]
MKQPPDYLLLGHFTTDVLPDGKCVPGGTSLYAALAAHRLGLTVSIVSAQITLPPDWPATIDIAFHPTYTPPTFENRYTTKGRQQILHTATSSTAMADVPFGWRGAPIVHLGPMLQEIPEDFVLAFPQALLGVTPQGWMRAWGPQLPTPIQYKPWLPSPELLSHIDVVVVSIEDVQGDEALIAYYAQTCKLVALTRGSLGATLFWEGVPYHIPAVIVHEVDPTGAGDVFAAALLVYLRETSNPLEAARIASYVAAISVQGRGASHIPTRDEIEHYVHSGE